MKCSMLTLEEVTRHTAVHPAVVRLSLNVAAGECFVLLAPPRSGTTTLLRMIAGQLAPEQGHILVGGQDVTHLAPEERSIRLLTPHNAPDWYRSVGSAVLAGLTPQQRRSITHQQREALLELVGLTGMEQQRIYRLTPGQRLRVLFAQALLAQPVVLLLDDPFARLDTQSRAELRSMFRNVQRELGMTTIFATHERDEAFELADRVGVMHHGRLLEAGAAEELYQHPQTEFVATFLGSANLLVGQSTERGIQAGPLHFSIQTAARHTAHSSRVQVLFRPEDVALAPACAALAGTPLGQAEVVSYTFAGSFERLCLRLPPIPGVRPIAPTVPFGESCVLIEALRSLDQARHFPLRPGDSVWVGVRRMHALPHPGMHFLLLSDGSPGAQDALTMGKQLAQLSHARTTLLGCGPDAGRLQRHLHATSTASGHSHLSPTVRISPDSPVEAVTREVQHQPCDLVVLGYRSPDDLELAERLLLVGEHHLLLIPRVQPPPMRILVCVAGGEPAKETIRFAGRLVRHLGASATLLSVLPVSETPACTQEHLTRFLAAGRHTLAVLGVPAQTIIQTGDVCTCILDTLRTGNHDMLVLGAPLNPRRGLGTAGKIVRHVPNYPTLIVRSPDVAAQTEWRKPGIVASIVEEFMA